jgi:hypothetical protein
MTEKTETESSQMVGEVEPPLKVEGDTVPGTWYHPKGSRIISVMGPDLR